MTLEEDSFDSLIWYYRRDLRRVKQGESPQRFLTAGKMKYLRKGGVFTMSGRAPHTRVVLIKRPQRSGLILIAHV